MFLTKFLFILAVLRGSSQAQWRRGIVAKTHTIATTTTYYALISNVLNLNSNSTSNIDPNVLLNYLTSSVSGMKFLNSFSKKVKKSFLCF